VPLTQSAVPLTQSAVPLTQSAVPLTQSAAASLVDVRLDAGRRRTVVGRDVQPTDRRCTTSTMHRP